MLATIIIGVLLAAVVAAIIVRAVKNKKRGKPSCCSGCAHCAMSSGCHSAGGSAEPRSDK